MVNANPLAQRGADMQEMTGVLARIFSGGRDVPPLARAELRRTALDSLKRLVECRLDSPELSVQFICARSGWSRATVYRLFESEGGLARYIRTRRLLRALRELVSVQQARQRIIDLAVAHQFSSEATFNRAFRRAFGIPPGKARDLAASSRSDRPLAPQPRRTDRANSIRWIKLAGGRGFEPRLPESKSGVLPLDDPPPHSLGL